MSDLDLEKREKRERIGEREENENGVCGEVWDSEP